MGVALSSQGTGVGAARGVLEASATAAAESDGSTLAIVVATEGSTCVRAGAVALFGPSGQQSGWLSGGCLEPRIAEQAQLAALATEVGRIDVDTRDDADLLTGSALGCRGRLVISLVPLTMLPGWPDVVSAWLQERAPLRLDSPGCGHVRESVGPRCWDWEAAFSEDARGSHDNWSVSIPHPPSALVRGAGPETAVLVPLLIQLGWRVTVVERRDRWMELARLADRHIASTPSDAVTRVQAFDAALVMHHDFEMDREALEMLADTTIPFVGLLGPNRRREDLFSVLPPQARDALPQRLKSPESCWRPAAAAGWDTRSSCCDATARRLCTGRRASCLRQVHHRC